MILSTLADETAFHAAAGWDDTNARRPAPRGPNGTNGAYVIGSPAPHTDLENDTLLDYERMLVRTGLDYEPICEAWAKFWKEIYPPRVDPSTLTAASDLASGCHTWCGGLIARYRRLNDSTCLDAAIQIGATSEKRYAANALWQQGYSGHRSIGRHLRSTAELISVTQDARWRTLADRIVSRLLSTPYWDERGIFYGVSATDQLLGAGAYARGAKLYSTIELGALADGLIGYLEEMPTGQYATEVDRRLLLMATWTRDHGLDPYNEFGGLFMAADWPQPGMVYNHFYGLDPIPGAGLSGTYSSDVVNLETWGFLRTKQRSFLDRAVLHYFRGSTSYYNDVTRSRAAFDARKVHRYINSAYMSNTYYVGDPQHGDLFYVSALPAVYLAAVEDGDVTAPAAPTLTLGSPVWSD